MFIDHSLEDKIKQTEKKIKELELQNEALLREVEKYYKELQFSPEQIEQFFNDPAHFTPEGWEAFQHHRKEIEADLQTKINSISDPRKAKKNYESRNLPSYALFVR